MAIALLFTLAVFIAWAVRNAILKWKKVDENIDKLIAIEKAQELIRKEQQKLK
ncbi:MAG: hypothetical protein ACR2M7_02500 [Bdellovibrionales bacterium]